MLERYLAAVEYAGAALTWGDDTIAIHAVEKLDASRIDPWVRRWAGDARAGNPALRRVPPTALVLASAHVDATALRDAIFRFASAEEQPRLHNFEVLATGLLLGQDLRTRILTGLGPSLIAYLDSPTDSDMASAVPGPSSGRASLFPVVVVIGFSDDAAGDGARPSDRSGEADGPKVALAAALDNGLRTALAMTALDEKRGEGRSRITTRVVAGATVTTLDIPIPFAYAVDRVHGRLVLGTAETAVAHFLESSSDPQSGHRYREFQAVAFPDFETFVCIDLDTLRRLADRHRDRLARNFAARQKRPVSEVEKDLDHVLTLAGLFRAAYLSSRIEPDASAVHRRVGVILHQPKATTLPKP